MPPDGWCIRMRLWGRANRLPGRARAEEELAHGGGQADADGADVAPHVLHGVVDGQAVGDRTAGRVDVHRDVLLVVLGLEEDELGADQVGGVLVDGRPDEDDPLLQQALEDVRPGTGIRHRLRLHGRQGGIGQGGGDGCRPWSASLVAHRSPGTQGHRGVAASAGGGGGVGDALHGRHQAFRRAPPRSRAANRRNAGLHQRPTPVIVPQQPGHRRHHRPWVLAVEDHPGVPQHLPRPPRRRRPPPAAGAPSPPPGAPRTPRGRRA